ncbi:peptidase, partial [Pseudomonas sp. FW305-33]
MADIQNAQVPTAPAARRQRSGARSISSRLAIIAASAVALAALTIPSIERPN